jgi:hypothetical protein
VNGILQKLMLNSPILANEWVEGLCRLLDSLVEGFRWSVSVGTKDLVLSQEETLNSTHQLEGGEQNFDGQADRELTTPRSPYKSE